LSKGAKLNVQTVVQVEM